MEHRHGRVSVQPVRLLERHAPALAGARRVVGRSRSRDPRQLIRVRPALLERPCRVETTYGTTTAEPAAGRFRLGPGGSPRWIVARRVVRERRPDIGDRHLGHAIGRARSRLLGSRLGPIPHCLSVAPDGSWVAAAQFEHWSGDRQDGRVRVWDVATGETLHVADFPVPVRPWPRRRTAPGSPQRSTDRSTVGAVRCDCSVDGWRPLTSLRVAGTLYRVLWANDVLVAVGDRGVYCFLLQNA